jgi:hypothetical protein
MRPADGQWQSRPVHVELVQIRANGLEPSERHWREGLVDLVEIDVLNREAGGFERAPDSVDRLLQHDDRVPAVTVRLTMRAIGLILWSFRAFSPTINAAEAPSQLWPALVAV